MTEWDDCKIDTCNQHRHGFVHDLHMFIFALLCFLSQFVGAMYKHGHKVYLFQAVTLPADTYLFQFGATEYSTPDNWYYFEPQRRFLRGGFTDGLAVYNAQKTLKLIDLTNSRAKSLCWELLTGQDHQTYSPRQSEELVQLGQNLLSGRYDGFISCENDDGDLNELEAVIFDTSDATPAFLEQDILSLVDQQWGLIDRDRAIAVLGEDYEGCIALSWPGAARVHLSAERVFSVLERKLKDSLPNYETRLWKAVPAI